MPNQFKERPISLLGRDFAGFKDDLLKYLDAHHTGAIQDRNESSPGMALIELTAFVGDNLSFYLDQAFLEMKRETARQLENVQSFAKSLGYRPLGKRPSRGLLTWAVEVPATTNASGDVVPDDSSTPILVKGARAGGPNGSKFETLEDVVFSSSLGRMVTGSRFDASSGFPTYFAIRKDVEVVAGETKTESFTISDFQQFRTISLSNSDVIEVISVIDSDGNEWVEVDYLAQDMVFDSAPNGASDSDSVPYVLKLVPAPRRFIVDRDITTGQTSLVFGSGDGNNFDDELVPNIADMALPLYGRKVVSSFAIDPRNFLKTRSLGLSPYGTTLTVKYRVGGGTETNVPPKSVRSVIDATLSFSTTNISPTVQSTIIGSLACTNISEIKGGGPAETIQEIKNNSAAFFAAQNRVVTREDYIVRALSLPAKFGKPEKVFVKRNSASALAIDVHVLSIDSSNHLALASPTLKKNIATYLDFYRIATDGINILDSDIINIGLDFGVVVGSKFNKSEVLAKCIDVLMDKLDTTKMQIGQPIVVSDLIAEVQNVKGVMSVYKMAFQNMTGADGQLSYSSVRFDVDVMTKNAIMYCPENSIFEVKYPRHDIVGVAK